MKDIFNKIQVVKPNFLHTTPGGYYNLNEDNETERRVVKLHMLKTFVDLCSEDICECAENHTLLGPEIEALADALFEVYEPYILKGYDVFDLPDFHRPEWITKYDKLFQAFKASGRDVDNVDYDGPARVYGPDGYLHITNTRDWDESYRKGNKWHLIIGNLQWLSNDLEYLEYRLFTWAYNNGHIDSNIEEKGE